MHKFVVPLLLAVVIAPGALAQTPTTDMISGADLQRNLDPETRASQRYNKGLSFLRKANKAEAKGQPQEKVVKNLERAADYFQQAINQYYNLGVAHCELGCTLVRLGRLEEAGSSLMVAAAIEHDSERVKECQELLAEARSQAAAEARSEPGA